MSEAVSFRPVSAVRLYQDIVDQIESALIAGELTPGERLPSERTLMSQFGTSRSTVREALRVLESHGVVRSRPGDPRGPELLEVSTHEVAAQMTRLARMMDDVDIAELVTSRMILDSSASKLAAAMRTENDLRALEASVARMRAAVDDGRSDAGRRFSDTDVEFHDLVSQASHNSLVQMCNQVVRNLAQGLISDNIERADDPESVMRNTLRQHEAVLDAVRSSDATAASRLSRQSLFDYYGGYLEPADRDRLRLFLDD